MAIPGASRRDQIELRRRQAAAIRRAQESRREPESPQPSSLSSGIALRLAKEAAAAQLRAKARAQEQAREQVLMRKAKLEAARRKSVELARRRNVERFQTAESQRKEQVDNERATQAKRIQGAKNANPEGLSDLDVESLRRAIARQAKLREERARERRRRSATKEGSRRIGAMKNIQADIDFVRGGGVPEKEDNSLLAKGLRLAGSAIDQIPGLKKTLELAAKPQEEAAQMFHAGFNARASGLNAGEQLLAGLAQTPGLGHLDSIGPRGNELRTYGDAVNTPEERQALREAGRYLSPGEFITGKGFDNLDADVRDNLGGKGSLDFLPDASSGFIDAGLAIGTDPLTYIPGGIVRSGLNKPTRAAGGKFSSRFLNSADEADQALGRLLRQQDRAAYLANSRIGRSIEAQARALAADVGQDVAKLRKAAPGLPTTVAKEIAAAPTTTAAQDIMSRALRSGEYAPDISMRRQALLATTGRGLKAPAGLGLGRRVIRQNEGLFDATGGLRRIANRTKGPVAATRTRSARAFRRVAVKESLRRSGHRFGDALQSVADSKLGMLPFERMHQALYDLSTMPPAIQDVVESTFEEVVPKGRVSTEDLSAGDYESWVNGHVLENEEALQAINEAETLIATFRGDFGPEAVRQLEVEMGVGFLRPTDVDVIKTVERAANRAGLALPKKGGLVNKATKKNIAKVAKELKDVADDDLRADLQGILARVQAGKVDKRKAVLRKLQTTARLAKNSRVAEDAAGLIARYGDAAAGRANLVGVSKVGIGQKLNPKRMLGKVVTSLDEVVAPNQIRFLDTENVELAIQGRVEAIDNYMGELGLDDGTRGALRQAAAEVQTERDLYALVDQMLAVYADAQGVPHELLSAMFKNVQKEARDMGFQVNQYDNALGDAGELVREVQNLSQLSEVIPLPDPADIKKTVKQLRKAGDDPAKIEEIARFLEDPTDFSKVKRGFMWMHRTWKLMVVTNLYMPVVGGFAGFVGTDGDLWEKTKAGFQWGALGALAPSRYVARIGVEETARRVLLRGFTPTEFIPGVAKYRAQKGVLLPLQSSHLLSSGNNIGGTWYRNEIFDRSTGQMDALASPPTGFIARLGRKQARYIDSWQRIVNQHVNDHNGALDRILLGVKGGLIDQKTADEYVKAFLKSEDGEIWWRRWQGAHGAPSSKAKAVERQRKLIDDYFDEELARVRLPAMDADFQTVPTSMLKARAKADTAPNFVYGEKTWTIPRRQTFFRDMGQMKDEALDKFVFGGPTRTMQRRPLARSLYRDEYLSLVNAGVDPKRAQQLADAHAINITNDVMFNQNNESRFSSKVDVVFPFQQPREELVRVWAPLAFNNKIRTVQLTQLGARALEAGASSGTFYEYTNPFTGEKEWRMKVPGSATLSRYLGGVNAQFDFALNDMLFLTQGQHHYQTLGVPAPGGPFFTVMGREFINAFPDTYEGMPESVKKYLFPYGSSGRLGRNEPNRLWMSFMGTPAPWEFSNQFEQENEYDKIQVQMFLHLRYEHFKETGKWKDPSFEEVDEATKAYLQAQALMGAVWPAPTRYVQPWQSLVEEAQKPYLDHKGELDYFGFVNDHPDLAPFVSTTNKYVGPDDFKHWSRSDEERAEDYILHRKKKVGVKEFKKTLDDNRKTSEAFAERQQIPFKFEDWEQADAYIDWEAKWLEKHPSVVTSARSSYFRDQQLYRIMHMAEGAHKDRALDKWRQTYDRTFSQYKRDVSRLEQEGWKVDYWKSSRPTEIVLDVVKKRARFAVSDEESVVHLLNPAEQVKYWKAQIAELDFYDGKDSYGNDINEHEAVLSRHKLLKSRVSDVYKKYPKLSGAGTKKQKATQQLIDNWRGHYYEAVGAAFAEAWEVDAKFKELQAAGKGWSPEGQALYAKRSALFDLARELKNQQFKELPQLLDLQADIEAATILMRDGKPTRAYTRAIKNIMARGIGNGGYLPSNEEMAYLNMPDEVKQAYVADLTADLNKPNEKGTKGKLFWEWISDFQRDLLERNLPKDMVDEWKDESPDQSRGSKENGYKGYGRGYYRSNSSARNELGFAYEMFKQYSQRPEGATAPAAYAEYLALPRNPAVRNQFLDKHPEVAKWISLGPVANMPAHIRYMVQNIMIKHGKWEGEILSDDAVVDLSFAREQMKRWNKRGDMERPAAYDIWLAMPTGVAKAKFLDSNPEVQRWLSLGPMANMPDAYQDVVRDIMTRYGEWTSGGEGLGKVISDYYATPAYARDKYLEKHPELVSYWAAIRSPEEKRVAAMVDQYFSIQDPNSRRAYLIVHPELKQHFVDQRNKRYERFLNQVAHYMGANPEMFEKYLERQEDVLNDLLVRYAEPPLLREVARLTDAKVSDRARNRG